MPEPGTDHGHGQQTLSDPLRVLLDRLAALAEPDHATAIHELVQRLTARRFRVLVVGEAKRGKSTLINAMIGHDLLPSGVTPVTALPTELRAGTPPRLEATFTDGHAERRPLAALAELVTEQNNPHNTRGVIRVTCYLNAALLADGVEIVDTPGTGSVFAHNSAEAAAVLASMDAAILVLTTDPPLSAAERDLLAAVRDRSMALFVAINKIDRLTSAERAEALAFVRDHLDTAPDQTSPPLYPVSARDALAARTCGVAAAVAATGVPRLEDDLADYLAEHRTTDLTRSIAGHADRIAMQLLDAATIAERAADLATAHASDRVERFRGQLTRVSDGDTDTADIVAGTQRRILAELNTAAQRDTTAGLAAIRTDLQGYLDSPALADLPSAEFEDTARTCAVARIQAEVDSWRQRRHEIIAHQLADLDARLTDAVAEQIATVREAARDELGVELALPVPADALLPEVAVRYDFGAEIGVTVAITATLRRHLPGRSGRAAVRRHLSAELEILVAKQYGRSRSALQTGLAAAVAALRDAADARRQHAIGGLILALDTATVRASPADRAGLAARVGALQELHLKLTPFTRTAVAVAGAPRHGDQPADRDGDDAQRADAP